MLPVLAAGVKLNADGWVCLWAFAWILAFGAIYPLNRNKGVLIFRRDAFALVARFWNRGVGGRAIAFGSRKSRFPTVNPPRPLRNQPGKWPLVPLMFRLYTIITTPAEPKPGAALLPLCKLTNMKPGTTGRASVQLRGGVLLFLPFVAVS